MRLRNLHPKEELPVITIELQDVNPPRSLIYLRCHARKRIRLLYNKIIKHSKLQMIWEKHASTHKNPALQCLGRVNCTHTNCRILKKLPLLNSGSNLNHCTEVQPSTKSQILKRGGKWGGGRQRRTGRTKYLKKVKRTIIPSQTPLPLERQSDPKRYFVKKLQKKNRQTMDE